MNPLFCAVVVCLCLLQQAAVGGTSPNQIAIKIAPGFQREGAWPLGVSLAFKEGQVRTTSAFGMADAANRPVPAAFETRATWEDGSIKWLWADFVAEPKGAFSFQFEAPARIRPETMLVTENGDRIAVRNGVQEWVWRKDGGSPVEVRALAANGAKTLLAQGDGRGIYLVDNHDRVAALAGKDAGLEWKVETQNPVRVVLRLEGWYVTAQGEKIARSIVRYHLFWQQPWIKMDHTFIVTRDNDEVWYKELGLTFPMQIKGQGAVRFGRRDNPAVAGTLDAADEVWIFQSRYPIYYRTNEYQCSAAIGGNRLGECREAAGWGELHNGQAGVILAVKDFAPLFPKEITARRNGLTAKLWSSRDGRVLDYQPRTMAKDWWQDWTKRMFRSSEAAVFTQSHWATTADFLKVNLNAVGVARTHELAIGYYAGPSDPQRTEAWAGTFQTPPVAFADPRWMTRVDDRVLWRMAAKGEGGPPYESLERAIPGWFKMNRQLLELFPYTGWYDYGKLFSLRYEKVTEENNRIYAQWMRVGTSANYQVGQNLLYAWVRSGDRAWLETAQRFNRWQCDQVILHADGGKLHKKRGFYTTGAAVPDTPTYWGGDSGLWRTDGAYVAGMALEYFLCDTRILKDYALSVAEAYARNFVPNKTTLKDCPDMRLSDLLACYNLTGDRVFLQKAEAVFRMVTDPAALGGMSTKYFDGSDPEMKPDYKAARKAKGFVEYAVLTGKPEAKAIALKFCSELALPRSYHPDDWQPFGYQDYLGLYASQCYLWTKDPKWLACLNRVAQDVGKIYAAYENLPVAQQGLDSIKARVLAPGRKADTPSYVFKGLLSPGKAAQLPFGLHVNGVPFVAAPVALWASLGYPE